MYISVPTYLLYMNPLFDSVTSPPFSSSKKKSPFPGALLFVRMLPPQDMFRTLDWGKINSELQFSGVFEIFPSVVLQN